MSSSKEVGPTTTFASDEPGLQQFPALSLDPLPIQIGGYRVLRELGRGGMGVVLLVEEGTELRALKILLPARASQDAWFRLRREFRAAAALEHPNIVRVVDSGFHEHWPYFTMEYVDGPSLRQHILGRSGEGARNCSVEQVPELLRLTRQIAHALDAMHVRGWIHGDLKPDNILVDGTGTAKLTDFGLARELEAPEARGRGREPEAPEARGGRREPEAGEARRPRGVAGTLAYMAPESLLGAPEPDGRGDLYALGVSLYELLTGQWPFAGVPIRDRTARPGRGGPRSLREVAPWLETGLDAFVLRLLAPKPAERISSAREVIEVLDSLLVKEPGRPQVEVEGLLVPALVGGPQLEVRLEGILQEVRADGARLMLLSGPAGWGKTRRLDAAIRWGYREGLLACRSRCRREFRAPFSACSALLETAAELLPKGEGPLPAELTAAAALVPALGCRFAEAAPPDPAGAIPAALGLLRLSLGQTPLLFLLDDAHWADELSCDFLESLLRSDLPLLIVSTYRTGEPDEVGFADRFGSVPQSRLTRLELEALPFADVERLVESALGGGEGSLSRELSQAVAEEAGGSPRMILAALARLVEARRIVRRGRRFLLKESSGRAPLSQSAVERDVLEVLSVFGDGLSAALLSGLVDAPEPDLLDALNQLVASRWLRGLGGVQERLEFWSEAVREEVYAELSTERRQTLHRRIASVLEAQGATAEAATEALSWHHRGAGDWTQALRYQELSVRKALRLHAYRDVLRLTREGLEMLATLESTETRQAARCRLSTDQSQAFYRLGRLDEALASALLARDAALQSGEPWRRIAAENNVGILYIELGQRISALAHYRSALALAQELGMSDLEAKLRANLGWLQLKHGKKERAREDLQESLRAGQELKEPSLETVAALNLAELELEAGELEAAAGALRQAAEAAGLHGLEAESARARILQGVLARLRGHWQDARREGTAGFEAALRVSDRAWAERGLLELAELELERGTVEAARDWLARLERLEAVQDEATLEAPILRMRAQRLLLQMRLESGEDVLTQLEAGGWTTEQDEPLEAVRGQLVQVEALRRVGREVEAGALLRKIAQKVSEAGLRSMATAVGLAGAGWSEADWSGLRQAAEARGEEVGALRLRTLELAEKGEILGKSWNAVLDGLAKRDARRDRVKAALLWAELLWKAGRRKQAGRWIVGLEAEVLALGLDLERRLWGELSRKIHGVEPV